MRRNGNGSVSVTLWTLTILQCLLSKIWIKKWKTFKCKQHHDTLQLNFSILLNPAYAKSNKTFLLTALCNNRVYNTYCLIVQNMNQEKAVSKQWNWIHIYIHIWNVMQTPASPCYSWGRSAPMFIFPFIIIMYYVFQRKCGTVMFCFSLRTLS